VLGCGQLERRVVGPAAVVSSRSRHPTPANAGPSHAAGAGPRADEIVARKLEIIEHGTDADALRAMESIEARIYGKPKETVVQESPEPKTLEELRSLSRDERRALLLKLEQANGGRSLGPPRGRGDGLTSTRQASLCHA
jgi:hypothetical protein